MQQLQRATSCPAGKPAGSVARVSIQRSQSLAGPNVMRLYSSALQHVRTQDVVAARSAFQECTLADPAFAKAWFEKRVREQDGTDPIQRCRLVLQRALVANPQNAKICQAWGLMELQRGNLLASLILLERCVSCDPDLSPVLRWKAVQLAKQAVCQQRMPVAAPKGVTCA